MFTVHPTPLTETALCKGIHNQQIHKSHGRSQNLNKIFAKDMVLFLKISLLKTRAFKQDINVRKRPLETLQYTSMNNHHKI